MLEHGGRLIRTARQHGIPASQWLDLSTGINPDGWPVPPIPPRAWQRLPEDDDCLIDVACGYYGAPALLPVPGSQAAIQALPRLRRHSRVGVLAPGYAEHAHAWRQAGHVVETLPATDLLQQVERFDVLVLIHPNNPGGDRFTRSELLQLHARMVTRGGWLIIDEAFIDAEPGHSLCADSTRDGLIILRSVGKFFGLAGARAGFVCAVPALLNALREWLGPWTLSGPTRFVVERALADGDWQIAAREKLRHRSQRLHALLSAHDLAPTAGCAFFQWRCDPRAEALHQALAERAILVRLFEVPASIRLGLPFDDADFTRLESALRDLQERAG